MLLALWKGYLNNFARLAWNRIKLKHYVSFGAIYFVLEYDDKRKGEEIKTVAIKNLGLFGWW